MFENYEKTLFARWYRYTFVELADPRNNDRFMVKHPLPIVGLIILYYLFVKKWGPNFMKNREPFKLKKVLILYNALQVCISTILTYWIARYAYVFGSYSWRCQSVDRSRSPEAMRITLVVYVYYISRIIELLDTVFFVLRKKDNQITYLHVFHHSGMPIVCWFGCKYFPGGHFIFSGWVNCMVHMVMYTYYLLSAIGPQMQKYLWWKKYITKLQLAQFAVAVLHGIQVLWSDCEFPRWSIWFGVPNGIYFFYLFNDFYQKAYEKRQENIKNQRILAEKNSLKQNIISEIAYEERIKEKIH